MDGWIEMVLFGGLIMQLITAPTSSMAKAGTEISYLFSKWTHNFVWMQGHKSSVNSRKGLHGDSIHGQVERHQRSRDGGGTRLGRGSGSVMIRPGLHCLPVRTFASRAG